MPQNQVQPTLLFLKCPLPRQENGHCYIIVRFCACVLYFNVVFLLCQCSPLIFDAFPSVLVCNPDLCFFFHNRFNKFEQQYITFAFICHLNVFDLWVWIFWRYFPPLVLMYQRSLWVKINIKVLLYFVIANNNNAIFWSKPESESYFFLESFLYNQITIIIHSNCKNIILYYHLYVYIC